MNIPTSPKIWSDNSLSRKSRSRELSILAQFPFLQTTPPKKKTEAPKKNACIHQAQKRPERVLFKPEEGGHERTKRNPMLAKHLQHSPSPAPFTSPPPCYPQNRRKKTPPRNTKPFVSPPKFQIPRPKKPHQTKKSFSRKTTKSPSSPEVHPKEIFPSSDPWPKNKKTPPHQRIYFHRIQQNAPPPGSTSTMQHQKPLLPPPPHTSTTTKKISTSSPGGGGVPSPSNPAADISISYPKTFHSAPLPPFFSGDVYALIAGERDGGKGK